MIIRSSSRSIRVGLSTGLRSYDIQLAARAQLHQDSPLNQSSKSNKKNTRPSSQVTKSVKDYAALPHCITQDGVPSEPLPSWNGGIETQISSTESSREIKPARKRGKAASSVAPNQSDDKTASKPSRSSRHKATFVKVGEEDTEGVETEAKLDTKQEIQRLPRSQLARAVLENLKNFPDCILLTRVGGFYESYYQQAQEVSKLLSIKLTAKKMDNQQVSMCGFPVMQQDKYLKILVQQHNRRVALCEEFIQPRESYESVLSKPTYERRVTRILTPGTLIDEAFLNPYENNFLLAISTEKHAVSEGLPDSELDQNYGLAWIDVSTGEFFTRTSGSCSLKDHIVRISPGEIVVSKDVEAECYYPLRDILKGLGYPVSYVSNGVRQSELISDEVTDDVVNDNNPPDSSIIFSPAETSAISILNDFLQANLMDHAPQTLRPVREEKSRRMQIDAHTLKSLEIRENIREGGVSGSLMSSIKRTVTGGGTRLLARWLCSPSVSVQEISARQALVQFFIDREALRTEITFNLKKCEDITRIIQKLLLGKGSFDDLISIRNTIDIWNMIIKQIRNEIKFEAQESRSQHINDDWKSMNLLLDKLRDLDDLVEHIRKSVEYQEESQLEESEDAEQENAELELTTTGFGRDVVLPGPNTKWKIKPSFSEHLTQLHERLSELQIRREKLQTEFRKTYNAPSLTLRHNATHGLHVHVGRVRRDSDKLNRARSFVTILQNKSTRVYFNEQWFALGDSIIRAAMDINNAEKDAFNMLRRQAVAESISIRKNARIFDEIDITSSLASLASDMSYIRPQIDDSTNFTIENGRHPTVEIGLFESGRNFVPNSISMSDSSRLHIITGPNMAGKSTFLRQIALITILAQIGSFVPANYAHIGLVDKVFTRIGAKDDLFRDQSTFMIEMLESADILRNATERSLVIMDEVGRGTTVNDGLAIAFATTHHIYAVNRCRALFATHFHEIVDMLGFKEQSGSSDVYPEIRFSCTDLHETEDGNFTYTHQMRSGVNRNSHGLKVAQLAGMPSLAIKVAENALSSINSNKGYSLGSSQPNRDLRDIGLQTIRNLQ